MATYTSHIQKKKIKLRQIAIFAQQSFLWEMFLGDDSHEIPALCSGKIRQKKKKMSLFAANLITWNWLAATAEQE